MSNVYETIEIIVKYSAGAYTTNAVRGQRSSSTSDARTAAESMGRKLFGNGFLRAIHLHDISVGCERWALNGAVEHA